MKRFVATVKRAEYVGDDVIVLHFMVPANSHFVYEAGQYVTIYFEGSSTPAGKAYSLSSAPHEPLLSITVKRVGEFSGRLYAMKPGDHFELSEAYGHFNPHTTRPIVAFGAGVGIAPVWSVLKDELAREGSRVAHLFYTSPSQGAIAHRNSIDEHVGRHTGLRVHHHITRAALVPQAMHRGRIDLDKCLKAVEGEVTYLVCGSVEFVRDMWRGLVERGVPQEAISTETFFE